MKYLIIAAHPDDEVLGCGGSIAKWTNLGNEVHVLIVAEGATSRDKSRDKNARKKDLLTLSDAAIRASKILGVVSINFLKFPDNRMDSIDLLDVVKSIEEYIEDLNPEVIVTHHSNDLNIDHRIIHQAVITACRPQPNCKIKKIMSFEVPSSTEWQSSVLGPPFIPNYFEDITKTLDTKLKALKAYKMEMREWPHPRSLDGIKYLSYYRGSTIGCFSAEAFILIRQINNNC